MSQKYMPEESTAQVLDDGCKPLSCQDSPVSDLDGPSGMQDVNESLNLNPNDIEPLYEGEECINDSAIYDYKNREPVYEGESILAEYSVQDDSFVNAERQCRLSSQLGLPVLPGLNACSSTCVNVSRACDKELPGGHW